MMHARAFVFTAVVLLAAPSLGGQESAAGPALDSDLRTQIDTHIERIMEAEGIPGLVLAVVDEEHGRYLAGYGSSGRSDAEGGTADMTPSTLVRIGSATKTFTAAAIMQLVERGELSLDTAVSEYLPQFASLTGPDGDEVRVVHLLSHTSGIPSDADLANDVELAATPGETFDYSDANFDAAGRVLEAVSGTTYERYLGSEVFERLPGAGCRTSMPTEAERMLAAQGHVRGLFNLDIRRAAVVPDRKLPSIGLLCSAEASAEYLAALLGGGPPLLTPDGLRELWQPRIAAAGPGLGEEVSSGLGWFLEGAGRSRLVWHAGTIPNAQSTYRLQPGGGRGVFVAINVNGLMLFDLTNDIAAGVSAILDGGEPDGFTPLETARTTRVIVTTATSLSLLWLLLSVNAFRLRRRRGRLPVRGRRELVRAVLVPLVPDAVILLFFLYSVPSGFGVGLGGLSAVALDLFMLAILAGVPVAIWAVLRTALTVLRIPPMIGSK